MLYRRGARTEVINIIWREKKARKIWFSFHHAFEDSVIPGGTVRTPSSLGIFYYTAQTMAKKALLNRVKHFAFRAVTSPSGHLPLALGSPAARRSRLLAVLTQLRPLLPLRFTGTAVEGQEAAKTVKPHIW